MIRRWKVATILAAFAVSPASSQGQEPVGVAVAQTPGQALYLRHCAACHGEKGDGRGPASAFVFPKPRDFTTGRFKLVSAKNQIASREDINAVLRRGMPGSSMPPWDHLSDAQRGLLVDEVLRLASDGVKRGYIANLKQQDGLTDQDIAADDVQKDIQNYVTRKLTPGEPVQVLAYGKDDPAAAARGKDLFVVHGCHSCHGVTAKGDGATKMFDENGDPTRPRDLTRGIFKGGHDPVSLHKRILLGMPSTPMPVTPSLKDDNIRDLVHFIRSLSTEEQRQSTILKRGRVIVARVASVSSNVDAIDWSKAATTTVRTMPLWWRDGSDVEVSIQAVHDGRDLACRLSWTDASSNQRAVKPDEFEDMAAIQWCSGESDEPFLGMGGGASTVDLWHWRAGRRSDAASDSLADDYPFDSEHYRDLLKGQTQKTPDFITARAAGNPLATNDRHASNLSARGFGSSTFRPAISQLVSSKAAWSKGRWSVVFVRPLTVPANAGLSLVPGKPFSAAFAVWNGEARERASQKSLTVWQEVRWDISK